MKVLVTGANGLLATNVIKLFAEARIPVVGMIRDERKFLLPKNQWVELVAGDIQNQSDIERAMRGCTHVVHAAALTSQAETDYQKYRKANVIGTENLLRVAIQFSIQRFLFVSTANTLGYGSASEPGSEERPMKSPFTASLYARSKKEAERVVARYQQQIEIVIVHPTFMLGPYDAAPSSGKIFSMVYGNNVVFCPPGGKNFVHVADVALGVKQALLIGEGGQHYLLGNKNLSYYQFFKKVATVTNSKVCYVPVPKWFLLALGLVGEVLRLLRVETALSLANMRILCINNFYSNTKARKELGLTFQSAESVIVDALKWLQQNERISRPPAPSKQLPPKIKKADVSIG